MIGNDEKVTAFVSCSFHDKDQAEVVAPLKLVFELCGITPVVLNERPTGGDISESIKRQIKAADFFIVIATEGVAGSGGTRDWISAEIGAAQSYNKQIVVLREKTVHWDRLTFVSHLHHCEFERNPQLTILPNLVPMLEETAQRFRLREVGGTFGVRVNRQRERLVVGALTRRAAPNMSGATFFQGLDLIHAQMMSSPNRLRPDVFIGINQGGMMGAAYLEGRFLDKSPNHLGLIKTDYFRGQDTIEREIIHESLPDPQQIRDRLRGRAPLLLVVDGQMKRGRSAQGILAYLKRKYELSETDPILLAVVVACGIRLPQEVFKASSRPVRMRRLFQPGINTNRKMAKLTHLPDFLGFVSREFVKPPAGIP